MNCNFQKIHEYGHFRSVEQSLELKLTEPCMSEFSDWPEKRKYDVNHYMTRGGENFHITVTSTLVNNFNDIAGRLQIS